MMARDGPWSCRAGIAYIFLYGVVGRIGRPLGSHEGGREVKGRRGADCHGDPGLGRGTKADRCE